MKKINEEFVCTNCGQNVEKAKKTCRNHCPYCFVSLHIDWDIPWDRQSECWWKMYPTEFIIANGWVKILFKCEKCWKEHWNKLADDDNFVELQWFIEEYKKKFNSFVG